MSVKDFQLYAAQRILDRARGAGVDVPAGMTAQSICTLGAGTYPAMKWADDHPDEDLYCCDGAIFKGSEGCTCWTPVYSLEQQPPRPPTRPADLAPRPEMCGDCAFRPGSPERSEEWTAEALYDTAASGTPFWCHDGMRRPSKWIHPDGHEVPGDPDDWAPPIRDGIPYRADGSPALLCGGWTRVAARTAPAPAPHELNDTDEEQP